MRLIFITLAISLVSTSAQAGFMELGGTANYRRSSVDTNNYQESISYTGSLSYYFFEMSAIEFSYTLGSSELVVQPAGESKTTITTRFQLIGLDIVLTFAERSASFQPYIKLGGAHISKKIVRQVEGFDGTTIGNPEGVVPSAGIGLKVKLSKTLSFKMGVDAWTSPLEEDPVTVDYAGRGGLSWFF